MIPITFVVDFTQKHVMEMSFEKFQSCFNVIEKYKEQDLKSINFQLQTISKHVSKSTKAIHLKECMWAGENLWVLKPNDFNRGRGVHIFNKLEDLRNLISEYAANSPF